jgi:hypothetical protein
MCSPPDLQGCVSDDDTSGGEGVMDSGGFDFRVIQRFQQVGAVVTEFDDKFVNPVRF